TVDSRIIRYDMRPRNILNTLCRNQDFVLCCTVKRPARIIRFFNDAFCQTNCSSAWCIEFLRMMRFFYLYFVFGKFSHYSGEKFVEAKKDVDAETEIRTV